MPKEIDGRKFFSTNEILDRLGISRQTFWRWRREGKIPPGSRFRDRRMMFTEGEMEQITAHATRLEPESIADDRQLNLFSDTSSARG